MSETVIILYHGTSQDSAEALQANGWTPNAWSAGSQQGRRGLLYLTTTPENALWYANEKGSETVLEVEVPLAWLIVDPEDGVRDTVAEELDRDPNGSPGNVALTRPLPASAFRPLDTGYQFSL